MPPNFQYKKWTSARVRLLPWFLLKVRYVRILDMFVCPGALIWLFSPALDAVNLTLKVGFICPFVVDDPTYLVATIVVAQALCLSIFNLSPMQKTCLGPMVIKLKCLSVFAGRLMFSQVSHCLMARAASASRTNRSSFTFWCKWAGLNNIWWICSPNENCFEIFGRPMNVFLVLRIWSVYGKQNDFARQQEFSPKLWWKLWV